MFHNYVYKHYVIKHHVIKHYNSPDFIKAPAFSIAFL